jgi:hypothetical protein
MRSDMRFSAIYRSVKLEPPRRGPEETTVKLPTPKRVDELYTAHIENLRKQDNDNEGVVLPGERSREKQGERKLYIFTNSHRRAIVANFQTHPSYGSYTKLLRELQEQFKRAERDGRQLIDKIYRREGPSNLLKGQLILMTIRRDALKQQMERLHSYIGAYRRLIVQNYLDENRGSIIDKPFSPY